MSYAVSSAERPFLAVKNKKTLFQVSRVFGIGRNYSDNSKDEKKDPKMTVLFMKDAYRLSSAEDGINYPYDTNQLRYEVELVVAIGKEGKNIPVTEAIDYVYGYGVGIDFTKYDAQEIAKEHGWPWDRGKSFLGCAPCSDIVPKEEFLLKNNRIWLKKNNAYVQDGSLNQMIWSVPEVIALVSSSFGLLPGDLIFTGTPKDIGMTEKGDTLEGGVDGLTSFTLKVN